MDSIEAQALHAILNGDVDEARRLVSTLLKGEAGTLHRAARELAQLASDRHVGAIIATGDARGIEDDKASE